MGTKNRRNHSIGMNDVRRSNIMEAVQGRGEVDFAIQAICGTRQAYRQQAAGAVAQFLRAGNELPLPVLDQ